MRGALNSILKRWHAITVRPKRCRKVWAQPFWQENGLYRDIECLSCPRFDHPNGRCSVIYGTPIRKCVAAAIEANLHSTQGEEVLEIGYGRWALARNLVRRSGGRWTGIEPRQPGEIRPELGKGGYGHAAEIPFPDNTFDRVYGIQTLEHWGQKVSVVKTPSDYADCLNEIGRVLKPGGRLYLDAPIHYHGHEMFVMGDVERIRGLFVTDHWTDVQLQRWRRNPEPLGRFLPGEKTLAEWPIENESYPEQEMQRLMKEASSWLIAITARKARHGEP